MTKNGGHPAAPDLGEAVTPPPEVAMAIEDDVEATNQRTPPLGVPVPPYQGSLPEEPFARVPTEPLPLDRPLWSDVPVDPAALQKTPPPSAKRIEAEGALVEDELEIDDAVAVPTPPPVPLAAHTPAILAVPPVPQMSPPASVTSSVLPPVLAPGVAWPEALSQRPRSKRQKPWFEEVFDEDYLRTLPFMTAEQTLREVAFIKDALSAPADGQILDVGCGYGRHAIELGQRGLRVTGIDLSLPLLIRAADESQRRALSVNFVHADMREMTFENQFDGAYNVLTSFGYFDEETNLRVACAIFKALKPGGRFLVDTINRDYIAADLPTRVWWEGDGCVVLEEVDFNFHTSRLAVRRSVVFQDGRQLEQDISIRAYSLHELGKLLRQAGFRILDVSGSLATKGRFFGATSRNIIMVCEKPAT